MRETSANARSIQGFSDQYVNRSAEFAGELSSAVRKRIASGRGRRGPQCRFRHTPGGEQGPAGRAMRPRRPRAGVEHFGENYLQEALPKIEALRGLELTWHFIGRLQANKTRPGGRAALTGYTASTACASPSDCRRSGRHARSPQCLHCRSTRRRDVTRAASSRRSCAELASAISAAAADSSCAA